MYKTLLIVMSSNCWGCAQQRWLFYLSARLGVGASDVGAELAPQAAHRYKRQSGRADGAQPSGRVLDDVTDRIAGTPQSLAQRPPGSVSQVLGIHPNKRWQFTR